MRGARAVQEAIIDAFPQADIAISLVWINMLPLDNKATARHRAFGMRDARIRHFHDPRKRAGKAIAQSFGGIGKASWDVYLFFQAGDEWTDTPPMPTLYAHQLSDGWIDPARCFRGDDLTRELNRLMGQLEVNPPAGSEPAGGLDGAGRSPPNDKERLKSLLRIALNTFAEE